MSGQDIEWVRGQDEEWVLTFVDDTGAVIDLTTAQKIEFEVKPYPGATDPPLLKLDLTGTPDGTAQLDLSSKTTHDNTVVQARAGGAGGNKITVDFVGDSGVNAGSLVEVGTNVTVHYKAGGSTVADVEALIATSTLIQVKTAGTGATVLDSSDAFSPTALAGGVDATVGIVRRDQTGVGKGIADLAATAAQTFSLPAGQLAYDVFLTRADGKRKRTDFGVLSIDAPVNFPP